MKIATVTQCALASGLLFVGWRSVRDQRSIRELQDDARSKTAAPTTDQAEVLASSVERLRLALLASSPSHHAESATNQPQGTAKGDAQKSTTDDVRPPSLEQVQERALTAFAGEAVDTSWSRNSASKLDLSLRQTLPQNSRILSIDCRTSMCLIEIRHETQEDARRMFAKGFEGWPGPVLLAGETAGRGEIVQTVLASAREGQSPPYQN